MYPLLQDPILFMLYAVIFAILLHIIKAINNCFDPAICVYC